MVRGEYVRWLIVANECSIGVGVYRLDGGVQEVLFRGNGGGSTRALTRNRVQTGMGMLDRDACERLA
jgi:hypothetical protein